MLGAFYQPECVVVDTETLSTLPPREFIAGLAEVIKYGLIRDADFFAWIEKNYLSILNKEPDSLQYMIQKCLAIKADIVAQDEYDHGLRNLLNFGHTFGHALETACDYQNILHGEAVAIGMVMAAELSQKCDMISAADVARVKHLLTECGLLQYQNEIPDLYPFMQKDKKVRDGKIKFILLKKIGEGVLS